MSLWHKPSHQIEYADVDGFCQQRAPEGLRLDYKQDMPADLEKTVAAMANTLGGMILLGVAEEGKTTRPLWPCPGMPDRPGLEDQITNICQDRIYPPVRPQVRRVPNPGEARHVFVVIRVDESPEAPHAVDRRRCVYERLAGQSRGYELAEVDRIAHLLGRRATIEGERERLIARALERARHACRPTAPLPMLWASVIPTFPWRQLCTQEACFAAHGRWAQDSLLLSEAQKVPGGVMMTNQAMVGGDNRLVTNRCTTADARGQVTGACIQRLTLERFRESSDSAVPAHVPVLVFDRREFHRHALEVARVACAMYADDRVERPGFLTASVGVEQARGARMVHHEGLLGKPFVDDAFRSDVSVACEDFVANPQSAIDRLFADLDFGFGH